MGMETVTDQFDTAPYTVTEKERIDNWRSQRYPNLTKCEEPPAPPMAWTETSATSTSSTSVISTLKKVCQSVSNGTTSLWVPVPDSATASGTDGQMAADSQYLYIYSGGTWRRVAISQFT